MTSAEERLPKPDNEHGYTAKTLRAVMTDAEWNGFLPWLGRERHAATVTRDGLTFDTWHVIEYLDTTERAN